MLIKIISIITVVVFILNGIGYGAPRTIAIGLKPICIPEQYGKIERDLSPSVRDPLSAQPMVVLIKDAHCHYEAQRNIAKILDILIRDYKIDLVCIEGAVSRIDPSVIAGSSDVKRRKETADKYLKKGLLNATEALAMERGRDYGFSIYGVEDFKLYLNNLKTFRDVYEGSSFTERFIEIGSNLVANIKNKVYSKEALIFDEKIKDYRKNKLSLTDLIEYLYSLDNFIKYKNLRLVLKAVSIEKGIDFNNVEKERAYLIKECEKILPKEELEQLVQKSLLFRLGKMSFLEYYSYLDEFTYHKEYKRYCNLYRYIKNIKIHSKIDEDSLFKEINALIEDIYKDNLKDEISRKIHNIDEYMYILNKLLKLEITRNELKKFGELNIKINEIAEFLKIQGRLIGISVPYEFTDKNFLAQAEDFYKKPEEFYRYAVSRDNAFVENLISKIEDENKDRAVLIAGGFHAEGVEKLLRKRGINVITISPSITKEDPESKKLYLSRMMDKRINPDKMLTETGISNLSSPDILEPLWRKNYRALIDQIALTSVKGRLESVLEKAGTASEFAGSVRQIIEEIKSNRDGADPAVVGVTIGILERIVKDALPDRAETTMGYSKILRAELEALIEEIRTKFGSSELLDTLSYSMEVLDEIYKGDWEKEGYDQINDVLWHGDTHVVKNTIESIKALRNVIAHVKKTQSLDIPQDVILITAIAAMYHDIGYYKLDEDGYGTIKIDHELRSKNFVRKYAGKLKIPINYISIICLIISATQANVGQDFWNSMQESVEKLLNNINDKSAAGSLRELLRQIKDTKYAGSKLDVFEDENGNVKLDRDNLCLLLGVIYGAKIIASLDIYDTRGNAVEITEGLMREFKRDKKKLMEWLSSDIGAEFTEKDVEAFRAIDYKQRTNDNILNKARDLGFRVRDEQKFVKAIQELLKLAVQETHAEQAGGTKFFYEGYADGRIKGLGVWNFVDSNARMSFEETRAIINLLHKEGRKGELSNKDIEELRARVKSEAGAPEAVDKKKGAINWDNIAGKKVIIFVDYNEDYGVELIKSRIVEPFLKMGCEVKVVTKLNKASIWENIRKSNMRGRGSVRAVSWDSIVGKNRIDKIKYNDEKMDAIARDIIKEEPALILSLTSIGFVQGAVRKAKEARGFEALVFKSDRESVQQGYFAYKVLRILEDGMEEEIVRPEDVVNGNVYTVWNNISIKLGIPVVDMIHIRSFRLEDPSRKIRIFVNPFTSTPMKDYEYEKLKVVLERLIRKYGDRLEIIVDCGEKDYKKRIAFKLAGDIKIDTGFREIQARTQDLLGVVQGIRDCDVFISPDTFSLHAAAALGKINLSLWPVRGEPKVISRYSRWMPSGFTNLPAITNLYRGHDDVSEVFEMVDIMIKILIGGADDIFLDKDNGLRLLKEIFQLYEGLNKSLFENKIRLDSIPERWRAIQERILSLKGCLKGEYKAVLKDIPELNSFDHSRINLWIEHLENNVALKWARFLYHAIIEDKTKGQGETVEGEYEDGPFNFILIENPQGMSVQKRKVNIKKLDRNLMPGEALKAAKGLRDMYGSLKPGDHMLATLAIVDKLLKVSEEVTPYNGEDAFMMYDTDEEGWWKVYAIITFKDSVKDGEKLRTVNFLQRRRDKKDDVRIVGAANQLLAYTIKDAISNNRDVCFDIALPEDAKEKGLKSSKTYKREELEMFLTRHVEGLRERASRRKQGSSDQAGQSGTDRDWIGDLSMELGLDKNELEAILRRESIEDKSKELYNLLAEDGRLDRGEAFGIISSVKRVLSALNRIGERIPDSGKRKIIDERKEDIAICVALTTFRDRERELKYPLCIQNLAAKLKAVAGEKGFNEDMIDGLMEELYNADGYYMGADGNVRRSEYFELMVLWIRTVFGIDDFEMLNRYMYAKAMAKKGFKVEKTMHVDSRDIYGLIENYLNARRTGAMAEETRAETADIVARYVVEGETMLNKIFSDPKDERRQFARDGLENIKRIKGISIEGAVRLEPVVYSGFPSQGTANQKVLFGLKKIEELLDRGFNSSEVKWQTDIPLIVEGKAVLQPSGEGVVSFLKEMGERKLLKIFCRSGEDGDVRNWLAGHNIRAEIISEYPVGIETAVCMLSRKTLNTLVDTTGLPKGHRVVECQFDTEFGTGKDIDMMLASRAALILGSYKELDQDIIKQQFRRLYTAYGLSKEDIERYVSEINIKDGIAVVISLPPMNPFIKAFYNALDKTREAVSRAA